MLNIAIVDDHTIVRDGLRDMLSAELGLKVSFEANSGESAVEQIRQQPCDIVLLDLSLPGKSGIDVLRELRQRFPEVRILILTGYSEERYALAMLRNGADGYICKDCGRDELIKAIHTVAAGRKYISARTAELMTNSLTGSSQPNPHDELSEREFQVFLHLVSGKTVGQIASDIALSAKTISTYRTRLLQKLGVNSNAELAAYAIRHGLISEESPFQK